jgi:carnitine O-acetyltransferase
MTANSPETSERTFGNEGSLPKVPVPRLEDSGQRFLEWCTPLLDEEQLRATEAAVAAFLGAASPAPTLQAALEKHDADPGTASWLDRFWTDRYLGRRDRIALNANFFFLFRESDEAQVPRAAGLITSAVHYKLALDAETVPPLLQRGQPTSMLQHGFLFSTTRIPGDPTDTVRAPYTGAWSGPSTARHVVVLHRGRAFRMDVIGPDGRPHTPTDLEAGLRTVLAGEVPAPGAHGVGRLTTMARAEWAATRQRLLALDPTNARAVEELETALFCICLEDLTPADEQEACDQLLHGDSANRWFDKALSFVVFADGTAGINVEHCLLDGTTILGFVDFMFADPAAVHAERSGAVTQGPPPVEPVDFVLDDDLRAEARKAGQAFADYADANATVAVSLPDFGADRAKQLGMSPDAFAQMAFQLAHRRAKGLTGATYESIATRQWRHGRTEANRVVTPEVLRFVDAMEDPAADRATRAAALRAAAAKHVARIKECQAGDAPEQHLWELQLLQQREGEELGATTPMALYESPGWLVMRDDYLSTSSAPSVNIRYFGFGSTSDRCIGVAYVLLPDRLKLYLSTPAAVADQMHVFAAQVQEALGEIEDLLST